MGMYTGLRFKGTVKKEFRDTFEDIALNGSWEDSDDREFWMFGSNNWRASFIPCGSLCYMPNSWEKYENDEYWNGIATDGFGRTYNKETGYWTFQCSLKNYEDTIEEFLELLPYFIESVEHVEVFYEEWDYSTKYELVGGKMIETNDMFIRYRTGW